jgi:hypothetical protein
VLGFLRALICRSRLLDLLQAFGIWGVGNELWRECLYQVSIAASYYRVPRVLNCFDLGLSRCVPALQTFNRLQPYINYWLNFVSNVARPQNYVGEWELLFYMKSGTILFLHEKLKLDLS